MTDEEKLLKKISVIFQEAKETINIGYASCHTID